MKSPYSQARPRFRREIPPLSPRAPVQVRLDHNRNGRVLFFFISGKLRTNVVRRANVPNFPKIMKQTVGARVLAALSFMSHVYVFTYPLSGGFLELPTNKLTQGARFYSPTTAQSAKQQKTHFARPQGSVRTTEHRPRPPGLPRSIKNITYYIRRAVFVFGELTFPY